MEPYLFQGVQEQAGHDGVRNQPPRQQPEVLLLPREPDYGLLQPWLSQETKDHRVAGGPENLCCYLKKKKKKTTEDFCSSCG